MSPVTHFLTGWALANTVSLGRRERALVTLAAVIPDVDGLGVIPEVLTRNSAHPLLWFSEFHHHLHNVFFALLVAVIAFALAKARWKTGLLALVAFHLHLLEDVVGARGPDGLWFVPYFRPFSAAQWAWSGQWALNGWQNYAITAVLLMFLFYVAWKYSRSPLEMISTRADQAFVAAVRDRFPQHAGSAAK